MSIRQTLEGLSQYILQNTEHLSDANIEVRRVVVKSTTGLGVKKSTVKLYDEERHEYPHWGQDGYFYFRYMDRDPEVKVIEDGRRLTSKALSNQKLRAKMRMVGFINGDNEDIVTKLISIISSYDGGKSAQVIDYSCNREAVYETEVGRGYDGQTPPQVQKIFSIDFYAYARIVEGCAVQEPLSPSTCFPVTVNLNGSLLASVNSGDSYGISLLNSQGSTVGSVTGSGEITVGDSTVSVNGSSYGTVVAEGALNVNVHNTENADVGTVNGGTDVEIADVTLDYPDGTTEDVVYTTSDIVLTPHWTINVESGATSWSTTVPSDWDAAFTVSSGGQTVVGGGSISNISINSGSAVSTFEGQSLTATHTVTFDITGTVTRIELETE